MISPIPVDNVQSRRQTSTRTLNHFNALTTACILLEHIQTLERLRDEAQYRVEAKRQKLHFLQAFTPKQRLRDALSESIVTQQQMQDTPTRSSHRLSPRLRGLYDVHGPGCINKDSLQTTADFSPPSLVDLSIYGRDHEVVWEDDDDEALLCPSADEAVENHAGSKDASKEYCDQLNCFASPLHLVPSLSEIIFKAQEPDQAFAPTTQTSNRYRSTAHGKSPSGVKGKGIVRHGSSKRNNVSQSRAKRALRRILHHKKLSVDAIKLHV